MRVLWFSVTPSLFNPISNSHNGGGWIASLEQIVRQHKEIELGIAFYLGKDYKVYTNDGVRYYTLPSDGRHALAKWMCPESAERRVKRYIDVIEDFNPDVIQIFGSENDFGLVCGKTDVPIVIHIQGSMPPYHNALFPIGMNRYDFLFGRGLTWRRRLVGWRSEPSFRRDASREIQILKSCRHFMGRTEWDRRIVGLFNPNANYYHCEEALRDSFIRSDKTWQGYGNGPFSIVSVISSPWYKGVDLILKTAKLLKENCSIDFEWRVYGISDIRFFEKKYGISANDVHVRIMGSVGKDKLVESLCASSVYVHPSYIDNSPNSVCEAQYIGLPIIATNVGGISSLIADGRSGMLVPANDPYTLASKLKQLYETPDLATLMGAEARKEAVRRHNPEQIGLRLIEIYRLVLQN